MSFTIEEITEITHDANRRLQKLLNENCDPVWEDAPASQHESGLASAKAILAGTTDPRAEHERWRLERKSQGWRYGEVKDPVAKTSPWLVPYDELPDGQRAKDVLRIAIVQALAPYIAPESS